MAGTLDESITETLLRRRIALGVCLGAGYFLHGHLSNATRLQLGTSSRMCSFPLKWFHVVRHGCFTGGEGWTWNRRSLAWGSRSVRVAPG